MKRALKLFGRNLEIELIDEADKSVFDEVFIDRDYKALDEIIRKAGSLVVDVGAHKGYFSIYAAALNSTVKILVFEPEEVNYRVLKENIKRNGFKNIFSKNLAVAGSVGAKVLYLSDDSHNHSLVARSAKEKKTETTTLDKILETVNFCDLVKMDCEGAEFEILLNLSAGSFAKIKNLYVEFHEYDEGMKSDNLSNVLRKNGFKVTKTQSRYDKRMGFIFAVK